MIETEKLTGAIYLHNPNHPENYNHPETGRDTYIALNNGGLYSPYTPS
jgi:hypothetical protein